jgi:hypothetical protein
MAPIPARSRLHWIWLNFPVLPVNLEILETHQRSGLNLLARLKAYRDPSVAR